MVDAFIKYSCIIATFLLSVYFSGTGILWSLVMF
jgi:hypothetical protein